MTSWMTHHEWRNLWRNEWRSNPAKNLENERSRRLRLWASQCMLWDSLQRELSQIPSKGVGWVESIALTLHQRLSVVPKGNCCRRALYNDSTPLKRFVLGWKVRGHRGKIQKLTSQPLYLFPFNEEEEEEEEGNADKPLQETLTLIRSDRTYLSSLSDDNLHACITNTKSRK